MAPLLRQHAASGAGCLPGRAPTGLRAWARPQAAHPEDMPFFVWRDASVQHFNTPDGDYVGVNWPWSCRAIGDDPEAMRLAPDGSLSSERPELQVGCKANNSGL